MAVYKDKRNGTWYCKFKYKNWMGESKTKFKRGFAKKKDAIDWEHDFLQMEQGSIDMELAKFVEVYFKDKGTRLKQRTIITKRLMFEQKIVPHFGKMKMTQITASQIVKWQNEMMSQGYKDTYLRMIQNQITALFNHAERFYNLRNNPCKKVDKMGRSNAKEMNFWTKNELDIFIGSFDEEESMYRLMYEILFWTGCRCGELLGICYEDLDFEKSTIRINKTYYRRYKTDYLASPKTESSNRLVTVPEFLMKKVKTYIGTLYKIQEGDRIFQVTDRVIQKKLKVKAEKCGLTPIRLHDLRHSHVVLLIEKAVPALVISQRVGHDSVMTT